MDPVTVRLCAELYGRLALGQSLIEPPEPWAADWQGADPDRFAA
ncbi:hypothetical protein [Streptomyces sp. NBC_00631]